MKRKVALLGFMALAMVLLFTACPVDLTISAGSVAGRVLFTDAETHTGINVILEKVVNGSSASVMRAVSSGQIEASGARAASAGVYVQTTSSDGSYLFESVPAGLYVVYAVSANSTLSTVSANVLVQNASRAVVDDLQLVALGSISGTIQLDGNATGNGGILVYIAGTSLMAMTNDAGTFTISNVPVASGYNLTLSKNAFTHALTGSFAVTKGTTTAAGTFQPAASVFEPAPTTPVSFVSSMYKEITATAESDGIYVSINLPSSAKDPLLMRRDLADENSFFRSVGRIRTSANSTRVSGVFVFPDYFVEAGHTYEYRVTFYQYDTSIKETSFPVTVTAVGGEGLLRLRNNVQFSWDDVWKFVSGYEFVENDMEGLTNPSLYEALLNTDRFGDDSRLDIYFSIKDGDSYGRSIFYVASGAENIVSPWVYGLPANILTLPTEEFPTLFNYQLAPFYWDRDYTCNLWGIISGSGSPRFDYYIQDAAASDFGLPETLRVDSIKVYTQTAENGASVAGLALWLNTTVNPKWIQIEYRTVGSTEEYTALSPIEISDLSNKMPFFTIYDEINDPEDVNALISEAGTYELRVSLLSEYNQFLYRYKTVEVTIPE